MSFDQSKKNFINICGYCFAEWWVKPNNILSSICWFLLLIFGVFKINFEPCFEYLLVRQIFQQSLFDGIWNLFMVFYGWFEKLQM